MAASAHSMFPPSNSPTSNVSCWLELTNRLGQEAGRNRFRTHTQKGLAHSFVTPLNRGRFTHRLLRSTR